MQVPFCVLLLAIDYENKVQNVKTIWSPPVSDRATRQGQIQMDVAKVHLAELLAKKGH
jgi:hypothetical protein